MRILPIPEIFIGEYVLGEVSSIVEKLGARKIMVITDKGIVKAGIYAKLADILSASKKDIVLFDEVEPDPSIALVKSAAELARKSAADVIIGLGGGSSIDSAKVAAALVTNTDDINKYIGIDLLEEEALPIIAIPTTAGTGSEVTPIAILSDEEEQLKKGIVSAKIIPRCAVLDPCLTTGLPAHITAVTGMDALTHALEAYISIKANDYTNMLALEAIEFISRNIRKVYADGNNIAARKNMLMGSLLAGIAFANAGVAAVHAFAYPLGGMFHIPHGLANSLMLSTIMEFNLAGNQEKARQIGKCLGIENPCARSVLDEINRLCEELKIPKNLAAVGIPREALPRLAEGALKVTRLLANNPRPIILRDAIALYESAYSNKPLDKS